MKTLFVIIGPTGVGKTNLSIKLAQMLNTEIISSDSRQIYKELKLGTAPPSQEQLETVKHHLVQTISVNDYYNASMFEFAVLDILNEIFRNQDNAVMVGGSTLYIDAVCNGIDDLPTIDADLRNTLIERWKTEGIESLRFELKKLDPDFYNNTDIKNPKRILKGLEICLMTGKPYSQFLTHQKKKRDFEIVKIGLNRDREILYEIINQRVDKMLENGLLNEVETLLPYKNLNSLNTVGYKEFFDYFENKISLEKAIELVKRNSRHYAKRQLSWFNRDKSIVWFSPDQEKEITDFCLSKIQKK